MFPSQSPPPESSAQAAHPPLPPPSTASNVSIIDLGRIIREGREKVGKEVFEETVHTYVERSFQRLKDKRVNDFRLWNSINNDFDMFTETTWKIL